MVINYPPGCCDLLHTASQVHLNELSWGFCMGELTGSSDYSVGSLTLLNLMVKLGFIQGPDTLCEFKFFIREEGTEEILFLVRVEEEESSEAQLDVYCFCFDEFTWWHLNARFYYFVLVRASCPPKNSVRNAQHHTSLFGASGNKRAAFALLRDLLH